MEHTPLGRCWCSSDNSTPVIHKRLLSEQQDYGKPVHVHKRLHTRGLQAEEIDLLRMFGVGVSVAGTNPFAFAKDPYS